MAPETSTRRQPPVAAIGPKIWASLALREGHYREAASDPASWRAGYGVVALSALAMSSVTYTDLALLLTLWLANWVLIAVMFLAGLRWVFAVSCAWIPFRLLCPGRPIGALLRTAGFAHAPLLLTLLPSLLYLFDVVEITPEILHLMWWIVVPWLVLTACSAAAAAGNTSPTRALPIALVLLFAGVLFDQALDAALHYFVRDVRVLPIPDVPPTAT